MRGGLPAVNPFTVGIVKTAPHPAFGHLPPRGEGTGLVMFSDISPFPDFLARPRI